MSVSRETRHPATPLPQGPAWEADAAEVAARFAVSRETQQRLSAFAARLLIWNRKINLISRADEPLLWHRHIADALQLAPLIPPHTESLIDLGSGAGFPGLVLAIVTAIPATLIESDQRKAAFLREMARAVGAPVTVLACRIEQARCPPAGLITARALAPLPALLALAAPLLAPGGVCLFPKGQSAEQEIDQARRAWTLRIERHISQIDRSGVILRISEVAHV
jgi:16S rRNA (guanine527-N7)-methyltransferase